MTQQRKRSYSDPEFGWSEAHGDYLTLYAVEPTNEQLHAYIDARQRAHAEAARAQLEADRHRELVEATRKGAAIATASVLTVPEAAEYLKCSERTVVRLINRGQLKASKSTGRTLVRRVDLENLIEG